MNTLARYFHTVRHLRPKQVAARARLLLRKARPDLRNAPPGRQPTRPYVTPIALQPMLAGPDVFRFLNVERRCSSSADWQPPDTSKLWTYNLHYFDDLNARDAEERIAWHRDLLGRWVAENPPGEGQGWEPYPVSRRIVNWVKWAARGNLLSRDCHGSLAVQTRWLMSRLEYHILGNHLFANAKALMHAGLYFDGDEADRWYSRGVSIIEDELREQVLPDGGHFELSTMYHAAAVEDLLDLFNLMRAYGRPAPAHWLTAIERMQRWLQIMSHPDGDISFFNDAAFAIAPTPGDLAAYAARLGLAAMQGGGETVVALESSGYVRVAVGPAYLICDCAAVGPDYLPGHAHADTLSFEMSVGLQRVFVNSGTSEYGLGTERLRQRGTAAHNTVVIDGQDSSEVWGGFRVARRARARLRQVTEAPTAVTVAASHDGYYRLPGRNEHLRQWTLDEKSLHIEDWISGKFGTAEAYFHLPPEIEVQTSASRELLLSWPPHGSARLVFDGAAGVEVVPATWHPEFGRTLESRCVVARFSGSALVTRVHWANAR